MVWCAGFAAMAQDTSPVAPTALDGGTYHIGLVDVVYAVDHPQLPAPEELLNLQIVLGKVDEGYVAWRRGMEQHRFRLRELPDATYYASAIRLMAQAIVAEFNERGFIGIYVAPDTAQFDAAGQDIRQRGDDTLRMIVRISVVTDVRSVASGTRIRKGDRIDNPKHERVRVQSPVRPPQEGDTQRRDLLRKDQLDRYMAFLNRHPGRVVTTAVSAADDPGGVALDYLVTESRPWTAYFQVSNTGTEETGDWRYRFGLEHYQFTGNDDILRLDYITSGPDDSQAFLGSYEAPFGDNPRLRWKVYGSYNEFTADEVGFAELDFEGDETAVGGELAWNFLQAESPFIRGGDIFFDLVGGVQYKNIGITNFLADVDEDFFHVYGGLRFEQSRQTIATGLFGDQQTRGEVLIDKQLDDVAGTDQDIVDQLGRVSPDTEWLLLKWDVEHSFYLEPLLWPQQWWDTSTPQSSTLAHEVVVMFRGQHVLDGNRLVPQEERTAGGLYTVRGYEESLVAGDNVYVTTLEYRFHLPRVFPIEPDPSRTPLFGQPFRFSPQTVFGRPDWDLVLRGFADYARVTVNDRLSPDEDDHDLFGAGVGVEVLFKRSFSVRVDWGVALKDVDRAAGNVTSGSQQVHIVATFLY